MTRYRVTAYFPEMPHLLFRVHRGSNCLMCVENYAIAAARTMETNLKMKVGSARWKIERIEGVVNDWRIVATSETVARKKVWHHVHT